MKDEQFEKLMKNAAETYNSPPAPPLDQMWASIDSEAFGTKVTTTRRMNLVGSPWLRMAAVLVLGIVIGRSMQTSAPAPDPAASSTETADSYQMTTDRYLGQTVALLVQLPRQLQSGRTDTAFIARANQSLTTLRLLMDSPAASNPRLRSLFEDLELVLVQMVQMPRTGSATDAKLIRQAMQERDVMPRLRDAVAETPN